MKKLPEIKDTPEDIDLWFEETQDVKVLYEKLKEKESETVELHKTVYRPWGFYKCLEQGEGFLTKLIHVAPRQQLSYQMHNIR